MVHPCWAWVEGNCGDLHDHLDRHACHGSSCCLNGQSSSREDGSRQEIGECKEEYGMSGVDGCLQVIPEMTKSYKILNCGCALLLL